ncbi:L,D-transpeptidase family protein [Rhizorhabdus dicambivorans]|uniref:L,D-transpeptidase n=1 Tax=Rhizorhabdus dicambivorans TaxID=1850238 RepID=A0A2A4FTX8_9SPHN|nr:L,D-transpeptidase family protein [Rhizorhabdus dicambivorans]ATE64335.1 L,D-transpeptidase [Rhizorhabdus dicambivorans]PCE40898.1 L,D-transpeptidase [Rhizorhabdus dicambivorans]
MLFIGNQSTPSSPSWNRAFRRAGRRPPSAKRWLATLPLLLVAGFTFNGTAPAGITPEDSAGIVAPQERARWSVAQIRDLIAVIDESAAEGLDPTAYNADALRAAANANQQSPALDALATSIALRVALDYADGRIDDKERFDWHMTPPLDSNALATGLNDALDRDRLGKWLRGLLPDHEQYRALKAAYAQAVGDEAMRAQLRANLERWRWMPRDLGDRYIYVNVPSYRLSVMNDGTEEASYNVVVGAPKTPTPQLALHAQSIVANPSWTVPQSIIKAGGVRGKGFRYTRNPDGSVRAVQAPGPTNALGRIKIDMPNPHAIYLHDTPNHAVFDRENRALSHGCVRVQNIQELAALLQGGDGLDDALAEPSKTRTFQLGRSIPVYLVYFTAQAERDGSIRFVGDPYGRDAALLRQLGGPGSGAVQMAAR